MPTVTLTARWAETVKPAKERVEYFDARTAGLSLRVSPSGRKAWSISYRVKGDPLKRRMTLGRYPAMSLAAARKAAHKALLSAWQGTDPAQSTRRHAPTFADLCETYIKHHASLKKSAATDIRIIEKELLPAWGKLKASELRRRDIIALLDGIVERGAPVTANRVRHLLHKIYAVGIERDIVEANPCAYVRPPAKERTRDRVLTEAEIRQLWLALSTTAPGFEAPKAALRFMLATAQRGGEVIKAEWTEIDLASGWWTIPAEKAKNGRSHRVPLSGLAIETLAGLPAEGRWAFPSIRKPGRPITSCSLSLLVRNLCRAAGIEDRERFHPHDLRRTAASHMASMGTPRLVIGKVLNHVETGITAVYDRHSYDAEKRQALESWARKLRGIIHGREQDNIILLPARQ